jgi:hypothetical protein
MSVRLQVVAGEKKPEVRLPLARRFFGVIQPVLRLYVMS